MPTAKTETLKEISEAYSKAREHVTRWYRWSYEDEEFSKLVREFAWANYRGDLTVENPEYARKYRVFNRDRLRQKAAERYKASQATLEKAAAREKRNRAKAERLSEDLRHREWLKAAKAYLRALDEPERKELARKRRNENRRRRQKEKIDSGAYLDALAHDPRSKLAPWANKSAIFRIRAEARRLSRDTGVTHHADHIYPIKSPLVCGLHCERNLRVVPAEINIEKSNSLPGCCAEELWDPVSPEVYYDGELLLQMTRRRALEEEREEVARREREEARKIREKARRAAARARPKKKRGRKPMTAEQAARKPAVQALLAGASIRGVVREFGGTGVDLVRYARLVNPDYRSPHHKHGRAKAVRST